jgi:hypothetical protein
MIDPAWAKVATDWAIFGLGSLGAGLGAAWMLLHRKHDGYVVRLATISGCVDDHAQRLAKVEAVQASQPGHADLAALTRQVHDGLGRSHARMDEIGAALGRVEGGMNGVQITVARLETHLLEHGPRAGERS